MIGINNLHPDLVRPLQEKTKQVPRRNMDDMTFVI